MRPPSHRLTRERIVTRASVMGLVLGAILGGGYFALVTLFWSGGFEADVFSGGLAAGSLFGGIAGVLAGTVAGFAAAGTFPPDGVAKAVGLDHRWRVRRVTTIAATGTAALVLLVVAGFSLSSPEGAFIYLVVPIAIAGSAAALLTPWLVHIPRDVTAPSPES